MWSHVRQVEDGPKPQAFVDIIFAGTPHYGEGGWTQPQVRNYHRLIDEMVERRFPGCTRVAGGTHQDESAPHAHFMLALQTSRESSDGRPAGTVGWPRVLAEAVGLPYERQRAGSRKLMSALQDAFHGDVGRHCGLARGIKGSKNRHQATDDEFAREIRAVTDGYPDKSDAENLELARAAARRLLKDRKADRRKLTRLNAMIDKLEHIIQTGKKPKGWKPISPSRVGVQIEKGRIIARGRSGDGGNGSGS